MKSYVSGYMFKIIQCPFCDGHHAEITYEENKMYRLRCNECHNIIIHQDCNWDAAVRFFERLLIVEEGKVSQ